MPGTTYEKHRFAVGFETTETQNLLVDSSANDKTVRLNSRNFTATSGDVIGFQSKPRLTANGTQSVYGFQVSANMSNGVALTGAGSVVGGHIDTYVRGTTVSTIAGDVRGLQIELTGDESGQKTVSGYVTGLRIRSYFPAAAVTGNKTAIRIEIPESGGTAYDAALELTGVHGLIWDDDFGTEPSTAAGGIKVIVNGAARWIQLYSTAPS